MEDLDSLLRKLGINSNLLDVENATPFVRQEEIIADIRKYIDDFGFGLYQNTAIPETRISGDHISKGVMYACCKWDDVKVVVEEFTKLFMEYMNIFNPYGMEKCTYEYETQYGDLYFEYIPGYGLTVCWYFER